MKNLFLVCIFFISILSCNTDSDDSQDTIHELVGGWERADSNENFKNQFVFHADKTGMKISFEKDGDFIISNADEFQWRTVNNQLTLILQEEIHTSYSFNEDNQLVLPAISEIPFNRID